ncbi:hypothetical protein A0H81_10773 [Grifola frondosa]|uniref:Uncharacterized protein n=1 Tax=Grifola frondosa TaxID=5627 RepID=A0A1C7LX12_GRIFR|nr:hypothetical protein A0H81_10773 [Grifola frondosa]
MALLPVLLQISLVLFLAGLLVLLWPLHRTVAAIATVLVAFLLVFLIITTVLPAFAGDCPYQSPQAWGFLVMVQTTQSAIRGCSVFITDHLPGRLAVNSRFRRAIGQRLYAAIAKKISQSWRVRERNLIRKSQSVLDWHLLAAADAVVIDDAFLRDVVRPCFADIELDAEAATSSFYDIVQRRTDLFDDAPLWKNEPLWMLAMQYGGSRGGESALQSNQILVDLALDILFKAPKHGGSMQDIQHYLEHQAAYTPDVVLAGICRRLSSGVLAEGNGVCDMGVDLLLQVFSARRQWAVGSNGFKALASLVLHRPGNIHRYLQICRVAFDVASHLAAPNYQYEHVRDEVRAMFAAFIQALGTAKWETIDDIGDIVRNLSAILPRIPNLAYRDTVLITPDAIHVLDEAVKALLARMVVGRERDIFLKDGTETIQNLHSIYIFPHSADIPLLCLYAA